MKFVVFAALALAAAAPAAAVSYTTSTATFTSLGDTIGSQFDQITLNGVSGNFTGAGTYLVNNVDFTVGLNSNTGGNYGGTFTNSATFGGGTFSYAVPYLLTISSADSITLGGNSFRNGNFQIVLNPLTFANNGGGTVSGQLSATVTAVPEPATWVMMVAGFGLVGLGVRRRTTAVAA